MKYSIFNTKLNISDKVDVYYNALSDKFICLKKNILELDKPNLNSKYYNNLCNGGFIVAENVDEIKLYIQKAREIENDIKTAQLIINPTINCNFSCWYCYEKHTPSQMKTEVITNVTKLIDRIANTYKVLHLSFFGGEPLLFYSQVVLPIIKYAQNKAIEKNIDFKVSFTTNGYLFNDKCIEELKHYNLNHAQITLDGGKKDHDNTRFSVNKKGSFDVIIRNIKKLAKSGVYITLRINYTRNNIIGVAEIPSYFSDLTIQEKKRIQISFHKVWQEGIDPIELADSAMKSFTDAGFIASRTIFGPYCYADLRNSWVINYNGDVYKCTAVDFENTPRDGYLTSEGEIKWENDSLEKRMSAKFSNAPCLKCKILPICHGGCSSRPLLEKGEFCIFAFDEALKQQPVVDKLMYNINYKWKNVIKNIKATK